MNANYRHAEVLAQVYKEVRERFIPLADLAHGWEHVSRVYRLALHLADQEGADRFIVGMAALLHDLGHTAPVEKGHHADLSVSMAREIMQEHMVPEEQQQAILHAILAHSFSRGEEPRSVEACVVQDADRLDGLGAIGIMRWAMTGVQRGGTETLPYHPEDPFANQHIPDDKRYALDHFYRKLLKVGETMKTRTGSELAQGRTAFMHSYLSEFKRELEE